MHDYPFEITDNDLVILRVISVTLIIALVVYILHLVIKILINLHLIINNLKRHIINNNNNATYSSMESGEV